MPTSTRASTDPPSRSTPRVDEARAATKRSVRRRREAVHGRSGRGTRRPSRVSILVSYESGAGARARTRGAQTRERAAKGRSGAATASRPDGRAPRPHRQQRLPRTTKAPPRCTHDPPRPAVVSRMQVCARKRVRELVYPGFDARCRRVSLVPQSFVVVGPTDLGATMLLAPR